MEINGICKFEIDEDLDWYYGEPLKIKLLDNKLCRFVLEGYDEDDCKEDYRTAMINFLQNDKSVLLMAQQHVFDYYLDTKKVCESMGEECISINSASEIWNHIQIGDEIIVSRRPYGDELVYLSIECNCDWEVEHGMQIVFKNGLYVNKVGQYDGHLTNADAYDEEELEDVVYRKIAGE